MNLFRELSNVEIQFKEMFNEIVSSEKLELYDLEFHKAQSLVRVFVRNPETKTANIDDCVRVDKASSAYFEECEWIPENIVLEVSSPGLTRSLNTFEHFEEAISQNVLLSLSKPLGEIAEVDLKRKFKSTRKVKVKLQAVQESVIVVELEECKLNIKFEDIKKANIEPVWG